MDVKATLSPRTQDGPAQDLQLQDNKTFQSFPQLPAELQAEVINAALKNESAGDQIITLSEKSLCACRAHDWLCKLRLYFHRGLCSWSHVTPLLRTTGLLYVNSKFYYEASRSLFLEQTVVLTSREALELPCSPELVEGMRKIRIRDPNPGDSIFLRSHKDFDQVQNAHFLHHLLLAPRLESIEIDIEPFNDRAECSQRAWLGNFLENFAIPSTLVRSKCTGIGAFKLSSRQTAEFQFGVLPSHASIFCEVPSKAWNKITLTWHAVVKSWNRVLSASPEALANWSSYTYPDRCESLHVWSTCPRRPLAIRNYRLWRESGGICKSPITRNPLMRQDPRQLADSSRRWLGPTECQWYHWALLSYLAHTHKVIRKYQGNIEPEDQQPAPPIVSKIKRNFEGNRLNSFAGTNPPWTKELDLAMLVPGTDPDLNEVWTQLFAIQSRKIKKVWSMRQDDPLRYGPQLRLVKLWMIVSIGIRVIAVLIWKVPQVHGVSMLEPMPTSHGILPSILQVVISGATWKIMFELIRLLLPWSWDGP